MVGVAWGTHCSNTQVSFKKLVLSHPPIRYSRSSNTQQVCPLRASGVSPMGIICSGCIHSIRSAPPPPRTLCPSQRQRGCLRYAADTSAGQLGWKSGVLNSPGIWNCIPAWEVLALDRAESMSLGLMGLAQISAYSLGPTSSCQYNWLVQGTGSFLKPASPWTRSDRQCQASCVRSSAYSTLYVGT